MKIKCVHTPKTTLFTASKVYEARRSGQHMISFKDNLGNKKCLVYNKGVMKFLTDHVGRGFLQQPLYARFIELKD
jgi:hypothetical protein